jgi:tetratricopeptide (TPR) repeat protein
MFKLFITLLAILGGAWLLLYSFFLANTELDGVEVDLPVVKTHADASGRAFENGRSRLSRQGKLWVLELVGTPEEIGSAHGKLLERLLEEQDDAVSKVLRSRFGEWLDAWASRMLLRWDYREADHDWPEASRRELAALAAEVHHREDEPLSPYHRLVLQQCFFDLARRLQDSIVGGSMFAISTEGPESNKGASKLLLGRNFTIDLGMDFLPERIVTIYRPDGKYPFASVGWPGMVGVVTGLNARGVFVAANPARTDDPGDGKGRPLPLVLREILETADNLDRAVEMLEGAETRTAGTVLIGDGVAHQAVIVELKPRATDEGRHLRGEKERVIWATDHLVSEAFERDAQNERVMRTTASGYRFERLAELLNDAEAFGPDEAAEVLRDRRGKDSASLGLGNRYALENLATTHSVVVDATAMVLWVGEGPSTLGRYRALDLRHLLRPDTFRPSAPQDFQPDRLLYSEEYNDYQVALEELAYARRLFGEGRVEEARFSAEVALSLAPDIGPLHRLLGDIYRDLEDTPAAITAYKRYLELVPGRHRDQERARGILSELEG